MTKHMKDIRTKCISEKWSQSPVPHLEQPYLCCAVVNFLIFKKQLQVKVLLETESILTLTLFPTLKEYLAHGRFSTNVC